MILSEIEQCIKAKIEAIGTPLKEWNVNIYRGILTGYNDAFIIDKAKKEEILANCQSEEERKKTDELIRPILRGRDIKRYGYEFADLYLLFIPWHFPLHQRTPEIKGASKEAEKAFENQYPAIYNHLLQYKEELSNRNKAETGIRYEWYALQRWGANYWEDFSKQKIMYPDISERLNFQMIENEMYFNNTIYFITSETEDLDYLLKFLNSNLIDWYYKTLSVQLGEKAVRMFTIYVLNIPIPKNRDKDNIYESYQLTKDEIDFIEDLYHS